MRAFNFSRIPKSSFPPVSLPWDKPVSLEIGGGAGLFAVQWAKANPDKHLITIERHKGRFEKLQRRLVNNQVSDQVTPVRDNAIWWITHNLPTASMEEVFLLYPNPYPKHPNRRWARMPFMEKLLSVLKPGGTLTMTTNEAFYADEAKSYMLGHWSLDLTKEQQIDARQNPRSHFERKFFGSKQPCWEMVFTLRTQN